jgi:hypothetical protein
VSSVFINSIMRATDEVLDNINNSVLEEETVRALEDLLENFYYCTLDIIIIRTSAETADRAVNNNNNSTF